MCADQNGAGPLVTGRPFTPPPAPDPPAVGRLQVQRAARSVRERGRWWAAFSGAVMGAAGWAYLWGFVVPPSAPALLCLALPGALCLLAGVAYFGLPLVDEGARWWLWWQSSQQEIGLRWDVARRRLRTEAAYSRRWHREPSKARYVAVKTPMDGIFAESRGISAESDTRQLPALPAPPPYYGTAAQAIVAAALAGQPTGVNTLGRRLGKAAHGAAMDRLLRAEVLTPPTGRGSGPALAPSFARLRDAPALCHAEVARALGAPGPSPTETITGPE